MLCVFKSISLLHNGTTEADWIYKPSRLQNEDAVSTSVLLLYTLNPIEGPRYKIQVAGVRPLEKSHLAEINIQWSLSLLFSHSVSRRTLVYVHNRHFFNISGF